ncbi:MAG: hypothetical protein ACE37F_06290 [Nannocystaceae bacterium]|nr:hypothetical protein [bacterium]
MGCAEDPMDATKLGRSCAALAGVCAAGCVGVEPPEMAEGASGGIVLSDTRGESTSGTDAAGDSAAAASSGAGEGGGGESTSASTDEPGSTGPGTTDPASSSTTASGDSSGGEPGCVDPGTSVVDFSYIWIANTTQGTVSKIDTQSATEVGRYLVDDYEGASIASCQGPSRTSVNLDGDVAVLDRGGGLTKVIADDALCPDVDGSGSIDTSTGPEYRAWLEDECVDWHVEIPHSGNGCDGPRTVQWTAPDPLGNCEYASPRVWVAFCNAEDDDVTVWLLDGDDGSLVQETAIPGYDCNTYGPYGGVVDSSNNLYFVDRSSGQSLYEIEYDCVQADPSDCWTEYPQPGGEDAYGITIDADQRIWIAGGGNSLYSFDTVAKTYASLQDEVDAFFADGPPDSNTTNTLRGLVADEEGVLWIASIASGAWSGGSNPGLLRVDPSVEPVELAWYGPDTLGGIEHAAGASIDVDGYVWLVDTQGDQAFKIDPVTPSEHEVVGGLEHPYTYSDMTGFALTQVLPQ